MTDLSKDGVVYAEGVSYCWVDEDGERISPIHRDFSKAMNFTISWSKNYTRLTNRREALQEELRELRETSEEDDRRMGMSYTQRKYEQVSESMEKLTLTGKPPKSLRRLVTTTITASLTDDEQRVIDSVLAVAQLG